VINRYRADSRWTDSYVDQLKQIPAGAFVAGRACWSIRTRVRPPNRALPPTRSSAVDRDLVSAPAANGDGPDGSFGVLVSRLTLYRYGTVGAVSFAHRGYAI
jgi:hypothetical protein